MRRERDQFRDKFDQANEELEAIHHTRDKHSKLSSSGRSSPVLKYGEEPSK